MNEPIDIQHMPGFNPVVTNGIDSVSRGLVTIEAYDTTAEAIGFFFHPTCKRHGAMLRVSKDGIYRCGELGCDNGCYWP